MVKIGMFKDESFNQLIKFLFSSYSPYFKAITDLDIYNRKIMVKSEILYRFIRTLEK